MASHPRNSPLSFCVCPLERARQASTLGAFFQIQEASTWLFCSLVPIFSPSSLLMDARDRPLQELRGLIFRVATVNPRMWHLPQSGSMTGLTRLYSMNSKDFYIFTKDSPGPCFSCFFLRNFQCSEMSWVFLSLHSEIRTPSPQEGTSRVFLERAPRWGYCKSGQIRISTYRCRAWEDHTSARIQHCTEGTGVHPSSPQCSLSFFEGHDSSIYLFHSVSGDGSKHVILPAEQKFTVKVKI